MNAEDEEEVQRREGPRDAIRAPARRLPPGLYSGVLSRPLWWS